MPAAPITLHAEVEELPERRFLDRTIFSTRETDWYINLWSSINGYSLDYNTGYVVATLMDEEGNTVLSRQENQESYALTSYRVYVPSFLYMVPSQSERSEKIRSVEGNAFIDFPVSETVIYPGYHNNRLELAKIVSQIDSIRSDSDVSVKSIHIRGYASPESPYAKGKN